MTNQEDIVECLRPFCADVAVSAAIKTTVLRLIEESFDLTGEDTFLLVFHQTDALVSSTWNQKVSVFVVDYFWTAVKVDVLFFPFQYYIAGVCSRYNARSWLAKALFSRNTHGPITHYAKTKKKTFSCFF